MLFSRTAAKHAQAAEVQVTAGGTGSKSQAGDGSLHLTWGSEAAGHAWLKPQHSTEACSQRMRKHQETQVWPQQFSGRRQRASHGAEEPVQSSLQFGKSLCNCDVVRRLGVHKMSLPYLLYHFLPGCEHREEGHGGQG